MSSARDAPQRRRDEARDVRARAWAYVFGCYEAKKKAGGTNTGDEAKGLEPEREVRPAPSILSE